MTITATMIKDLRALTGAGIMECKQVLQANDGDFEKAAEYLHKQGLAVVAKKSTRETNEGLVIVKTADDGSVCAVAVACETDFVARTRDFKTFAHLLADQVLADTSLSDAESVLAAGFVGAPGRTVAEVLQEMINKTGENITLDHVARYQADDTHLIEGYIHVGAVEGYDAMEGRVGVLVELATENSSVLTDPALRALIHDMALQIAALKPRYIARDDIPETVLQEKRAELLAQLVAANKPEHIHEKILEGQFAKFYQEVCLLEQTFIREEDVTIADLLRQKSRDLGTPVRITRFVRFAIGA